MRCGFNFFPRMKIYDILMHCNILEDSYWVYKYDFFPPQPITVSIVQTHSKIVEKWLLVSIIKPRYKHL